MKVITEPKVEVVGITEFRPHPNYVVPPFHNEQEKLIATAGKVCYDSYGPDGNPVDKHVRNLVGQHHLSVVEHVSVSLFIEGISRGCSHEIVRHRHFSYSQRSTRYTAEEDAAIVLDPFYADLDEDDVLRNYFIGSCRGAFEDYKQTVKWLMARASPVLSERDKRKWARGKARQLLPHALETRMVMTGNLRSWREFLVKRSNRHAEAEIRRLAHVIHDIMYQIAPDVFDSLDGNIIDGYVELTEHAG